MYEEEYSNLVIDHFMCPRNMGILNDSNGEGSNGDPNCGDYLNIYIRVENNIIQDISFLVFGCPASIATSSMTTELAKKKTLEEALKITEVDIIDALGGLPENKKHCSNLGVAALKNAISNYRANTEN
ncbi:iron-sulfur cluster assembly scaffold protein [Clostridium botulinum]|uniref:Iron-sulfur cluster assembly scaffold protein n=1 Tax=Clostridium botulinum TaxID=1491 RepID=A0A6M0SRS5_CLOBO|nr:iron-sulfur cluster assembly scaffold protein [Clostridium botulinum]MBY6809186.1 iron-sulfur cluster assembly scaffold protein [Clostridium botulinum]MBY6822628.1 iron-sulfur cluster assembly scaffold protein [Clostridium botulinum]MBY6833240.1 iron-sulfur cluster assembly scaffold protein [Clostridium botulinum]MBY6929021.1 iron-sulfur cluster assembly scaffold protein [Clostridium botulinum]MBY6971301.1 iron-sulfur cluster assembly scaffold protein [Clostridium botulinum]